MKIAYGTYAMPEMLLEDAIPALSRIGYDGVEIAVGPRHARSMPQEFDQERRARVRGLLEEHEIEVPALFMLGHILEHDEERHRAGLEQARRVARLARDLGVGDPPVLAMGIGGKSDRWEQEREAIVRCLVDYAELAEQEGFVLAGEAHHGAAVDRSERALWVIRTVDSPLVRLHFDIVHFYLAGERIEEVVERLVPVTAHTHITDARTEPDGTFDLLLLGEGELDSVAYLRAMDRAGWTGFITLEVSVRVWSREGYDPLDAASRCYATIDRAFTEAGVSRS